MTHLKEFHQVYLLLGSNLGDRQAHLNTALKLIEEMAGTVLRNSSIYETAAWGKEDQAGFLNQALLVETTLQPEVLLDTLLNCEKYCGRLRKEKWDARTIDIDILYYDDIVFDTENLKIPHPLIQERRFVLVPMVEIASHLVHPILKMSQKQLLEKCEDQLEVKVFDK